MSLEQTLQLNPGNHHTSAEAQAWKLARPHELVALTPSDLEDPGDLGDI